MYFRHYVIHYIADAQNAIYDMGYRRDVSLCMRVWKEMKEKKNKKRRDKKCEIMRKN